MRDTAYIKVLLRDRLSKKRCAHSLNVAQQARELARKYGEDPERAYYAGLLHDICKEIPQKEQLEMVMHSARNVCREETLVPPLRHAIAGAYYAENVLGEDDEEILDAVRYHTVARKDMTLLDKIIYLADLVSEDRSYKGVEKMRKLAYADLDKAMLEALCFSVSDVSEKKSLLPLHTYEAYNYYANLLGAVQGGSK